MSESGVERVLSLPPESEPALAALRGAEIHRLDAEGRIWLALEARQDPEGRALERRLRSLPGAELFERVGDALRPAGGRVAVRRRPEGDWRPLDETLAVLLPAASPLSSPSEPEIAIPLRLAEDREPRRPDALRLTLAELTRWALTAPQVRLTPLVHAVSDRDRALVIGHPLPPLPGRRFVLRDGVLVPAGLRLVPALDELSLALLFGLTPGDLALVEPAPDESQEGTESGESGEDSTATGLVQARIPASALKPLRRSALRILAQVSAESSASADAAAPDNRPDNGPDNGNGPGECPERPRREPES